MFRARHLVLFFTLCLLPACASKTADGLRDEPEYALGHSDGCQTASARSGNIPGKVRRNDALYKHNEAYRAGWRAGYQMCGPSVGGPFER